MIAITFSPQAWEDYEYWKRHNPALINRIKRLLQDMAEHPYAGIGKPEQLRHELSGKWSRRINPEHRIIYVFREDEMDIYILSLRYHYR
jgi:toxin YoeB